jgi:hypothetical protein
MHLNKSRVEQRTDLSSREPEEGKRKGGLDLWKKTCQRKEEARRE